MRLFALPILWLAAASSCKGRRTGKTYTAAEVIDRTIEPPERKWESHPTVTKQ